MQSVRSRPSTQCASLRRPRWTGKCNPSPSASLLLHANTTFINVGVLCQLYNLLHLRNALPIVHQHSVHLCDVLAGQASVIQVPQHHFYCLQTPHISMLGSCGRCTVLSMYAVCSLSSINTVCISATSSLDRQV